jgi:hypothetical protein
VLDVERSPFAVDVDVGERSDFRALLALLAEVEEAAAVDLDLLKKGNIESSASEPKASEGSQKAETTNRTTKNHGGAKATSFSLSQYLLGKKSPRSTLNSPHSTAVKIWRLCPGALAAENSGRASRGGRWRPLDRARLPAGPLLLEASISSVSEGSNHVIRRTGWD